MKLTFTLIFLAALGLIATPLVRGQAVLDKTSLGKSQNDERDMANSLIASPQKYGKGEKKGQVNAAELKSKSIKDATFGGSLLNMGIDPAAPRLDASKEHAAPSEQPATRSASAEQMSSASKQPATSEHEQAPSASNQSQAAGSESTFSSLNQTATLADDLGQSDGINVAAPAPEPKTSSGSGANNDQKDKKDQAGAEKPSSTSSTEKSSTTGKPDGDH